MQNESEWKQVEKQTTKYVNSKNDDYLDIIYFITDL